MLPEAICKAVIHSSSRSQLSFETNVLQLAFFPEFQHSPTSYYGGVHKRRQYNGVPKGGRGGSGYPIDNLIFHNWYQPWKRGEEPRKYNPCVLKPLGEEGGNILTFLKRRHLWTTPIVVYLTFKSVTMAAKSNPFDYYTFYCILMWDAGCYCLLAGMAGQKWCLDVSYLLLLRFKSAAELACDLRLPNSLVGCEYCGGPTFDFELVFETCFVDFKYGVISMCASNSKIT